MRGSSPAPGNTSTISPFPAWPHLKLSYPLLADFLPRGDVAAKYGLFLADKGITARATVIVDKNGKVAWVKEQAIPEARDDKAILEELRKLG